MNIVAQAVIASVPWHTLSAGPGNAAGVPAALQGLATATTEEEAKKHYWHIDNVVVVQGTLYESALPVVWSVYALLADPLPAPARYRLIELLVEIAGGEPAPAIADVGTRIRAALREGLWIIYSLLTTSDPKVRNQALTLLGWLEDDPTILAPILDQLAAADPDPDIRTVASELRAEYQP